MKTLLYLVCFLFAQGGLAAPSLPCTAPPDTGVAPSATDTSKFIPVERVAEFEGGDSAWNDWIRGQLLKRLRYMEKKNAYGSAEVGFIVEKNGGITHVEILHSAGTKLDDVVLEIMSKCPRWSPALKHDHTPVMAYRRQWFTLQRPD
ncbi:MAG TPA: energy transducer TonB [Dinghuibacter sp.]|jgi:TonB family protein|uniref:energy transducer TonB n=1 Tax=Dinghuibacter sp. TaxID=2024697 RepID=UPI002CE41979|nr:energy transducer TonB [Dinghuibacter sp.]HTJ14744.1 energy transducer TonB [Dinghuibacter sp.]